MKNRQVNFPSSYINAIYPSLLVFPKNIRRQSNIYTIGGEGGGNDRSKITLRITI